MDAVDTKRINHRACDHPKTQAGREKCRRTHGRVSPSQTPEARKSARPEPESSASKPKATREPKPLREPKPPTEAQLAARRRWRGKDLTVPLLSGFIYKRMKRNRHTRYVFDREWVRRQYPGVRPEMVDAALQYLVDSGRISGIPR